jgi:hypothetical protein
VTYTEVYAIISAKCAGCHAAGHGGVTNGKLDMSTKTGAFTNLVGVTAAGTKCGTKMEIRVVASDSATSLLYNKVNGTQDCGERMPDDNPNLDAADIGTIKTWIDQGALDN